MSKKIFIFLCLLFVILLPFVFQKNGHNLMEKADDTLIIITPHHEDIRFEFTRGFKEWYFNKTGRSVFVDWRVLGGSQEIFRFLNAQYANAFEFYWTKVLKRRWSEGMQDAFTNSKIVLPSNLEEDDPIQTVRRTFLDSNVTSGIDILFGGGEIEAGEQAARGNLVSSGIMQLHPGWFTEDSIPEVVGGSYFWDNQGRWLGLSQSGFGIIFNRDALVKLGYLDEPKRWDDLVDERFFGEIALADPIVSASSNRVFEMMFQQKVQEYLREKGLNEKSTPDLYEALSEGWDRSLKLIQLVCANGRYFTDSSTKPVLDVSAGDCAVGVSIDFYGLYQEENLRLRSNSSRFGFAFPKGGTVPTADVVATLRGAPNPKVALAFIEYALSLEGQKLWGFKVGTPGGPIHNALRRSPIRKELYVDEFYGYRSNPELNVYRDVGNFVYHPEWSTPIFKPLRFLVKVAFVDTHKELAKAWKAIIDAQAEGRHEDAKRALDKLQDFSIISYENVIDTIKRKLSSSDVLEVLRLQGSLTHYFRKQYSAAEDLAKGK